MNIVSTARSRRLVGGIVVGAACVLAIVLLVLGAGLGAEVDHRPADAEPASGHRAVQQGTAWPDAARQPAPMGANRPRYYADPDADSTSR